MSHPLPRAWVGSATVRSRFEPEYRVNRGKHERRVEVFPGFTRPVADVTVEAWTVFGRLLWNLGYRPERVSTWVIRNVAGTTRWSLHSYGIAMDIDSHVNGFPKGKEFSWSRTRFTAAQFNAVTAIRTNSGHRVFAWGGQWRDPGQDYMHWYVIAPISALKSGIDYSTVSTNIIPQEDDDYMKRGDRGPRVGVVQERLLDLGYALPKFGADEDFGGETEDAVRDWQEDVGLEPDGVITEVDAAILFHRHENVTVADPAARQAAAAAAARADTAHGRLDKLREV